MTVAQFRSDPGLVKQWQEELKSNGLLRVVLFDVMDNNHPDRHPVPSNLQDDVSPTRAAIELGATRGYSLYANTLKALSIPIKTAVMPEPQYEKEGEPE